MTAYDRWQSGSTVDTPINHTPSGGSQKYGLLGCMGLEGCSKNKSENIERKKSRRMVYCIGTYNVHVLRVAAACSTSRTVGQVCTGPSSTLESASPPFRSVFSHVFIVSMVTMYQI